MGFSCTNRGCYNTLLLLPRQSLQTGPLFIRVRGSRPLEEWLVQRAALGRQGAKARAHCGPWCSREEKMQKTGHWNIGERWRWSWLPGYEPRGHCFTQHISKPPCIHPGYYFWILSKALVKKKCFWTTSSDKNINHLLLDARINFIFLPTIMKTRGTVWHVSAVFLLYWVITVNQN